MNRKFFNFAMWWTILSPLLIVGLIASPINSNRTEPGVIALLSGLTVIVIFVTVSRERLNMASLALWWMILSPLLVVWAISSDINANHRQTTREGHTQAESANASRKPVHIDYDWTPQGLVPHKDSPATDQDADKSTVLPARDDLRRCVLDGEFVPCDTFGAFPINTLWSRYKELLAQQRQLRQPCKPTAFPLDRWYAEDLMLQNQWETQDRIDGLNNRLDDLQAPH